MAFVDKIIHASSEPVHFIRCTDGKGRKCFFFFMAPTMKFKMLKSTIEAGMRFDLSQYGKVIFSGFGLQPNQSKIKEISEKYNFDAASLIN